MEILMESCPLLNIDENFVYSKISTKKKIRITIFVMPNLELISLVKSTDKCHLI